MVDLSLSSFLFVLQPVLRGKFPELQSRYWAWLDADKVLSEVVENVRVEVTLCAKKVSQTIETWDFQFGIKISRLFHYPATVKGCSTYWGVMTPKLPSYQKQKSLYHYIHHNSRSFLTRHKRTFCVWLPRASFCCLSFLDMGSPCWWTSVTWGIRQAWSYKKNKVTPNLQDTKSTLGAFSQARLGHPTFLFVVQWKITRNGNGQKMPKRMDKSTYSSGRFLLGQ